MIEKENRKAMKRRKQLALVDKWGNETNAETNFAIEAAQHSLSFDCCGACVDLNNHV